MTKRLPTLGKLALGHYVYGDGRRGAWLVVQDPMSGRKNVYTVYRISLTGFKHADVIGRELPLSTARTVIRRDMETAR